MTLNSMKRSTFAAALAAAFTTGAVTHADALPTITPPAIKALGQAAKPTTKPAIVLVHGAFADASGWQHVIPLLEKDGYTVIAVQNPLSSLDTDIATTKRVIEAQKGPVVVVGHSYGGAVITGAAAGEPHVRALVYLAAFGPDAGELLGKFSDKIPVAKSLLPDTAGFLYIDRAKFHALFCADVPAGEADVMAATQKPLAAVTFGQSVPSPAWKTIPSWYLVSQEDHAISPDLERFFAKRMGAHTREIKASHVAFISHPQVAVDIIEEAAKATAK